MGMSSHNSKATAIDKLDADTCVEGVLLEPRAISYTTVALESAVGVPGIDLLTLAHGKLNRRWAEELVASSNILHPEYQRGTLRLLPLPIQDLGGNDLVNAMPRQLQGDVGDVGSLPAGKTHKNKGAGYLDEYSRLLTTPGFWKLFKCDAILLFQSDCVFCRNTKVKLSEFLQYPYIGGISPGLDGNSTRHHLNGGFSLRKRPEILKCIAEEPEQINGRMEDVFYSHCKTLAQPPVSVANRFAIDNAHVIPARAPFGVHKPWGDGPHFVRVMELCEGANELFNAVSIENARELKKLLEKYSK